MDGYILQSQCNLEICASSGHDLLHQIPKKKKKRIFDSILIGGEKKCVHTYFESFF